MSVQIVQPSWSRWNSSDFARKSRIPTNITLQIEATFRCVSWLEKYGEWMFVRALDSYGCVIIYIYLVFSFLWPSASMESTNGSYAFRLCQSSERNFDAHNCNATYPSPAYEITVNTR